MDFDERAIIPHGVKYLFGTGPSLPVSGRPALPHAAQPIPVHTIAAGVDMSIIYYTQPEKYKDLLTRYVLSTPSWKEKSDALQPQFARWSQATGIAITNLSQLTPLGDGMYIDELHDVPLPKGLSADDVRTIMAAGRWAFLVGFQPAGDRKARWARSDQNDSG